MGAPVLSELRAWKENNPQLLADAKHGIKMLERNPEPDGVMRRALPCPPYRPGTLGAPYGGVFIAYRLSDDDLTIISVQRLADAEELDT